MTCTHTHTYAVRNEEDALPTHTYAVRNEEDALPTNLDLAQMIQDSIEVLEGRTARASLVETYAKYNHEAYKNMPMVDVVINGTTLSFLVDSGATNSVVMSKCLPTAKNKLSAVKIQIFHGPKLCLLS